MFDMIGVLTAADAAVVAAFIAVVPGTVVAVNAWQTRKQFKPNGGASMRDAVDRIEKGLEAQHIDMLDVKADVRSAHDRLRSVEQALRDAHSDRKIIAAAVHVPDL